MLSILIPIYNYNSYPLVQELHKQCMECKVDFEILCQDDCSTEFLNENMKINNLENCNFSSNNSNFGRGKNINFLAERAQFRSLLIMDCDTYPTKNNYIQKYIFEISNEENIVYGGIEYHKEKPEQEQLLRWIYGNHREEISIEKRNSNPNGNALTSNLLIKKEVYISNKFVESITKYGYEDLVFLSNIKKKGIVVNHIDNPTFHLGLETTQQFLNKTKIAIESLKFITENSFLDYSESKILRVYLLIKRLHLVSFLSFLFIKTEKKIEINLRSNKPSLFLFDFYKLGLYCKLNTI